MGRVMRKYEFIPELVISSPAERAKQTADLAREAGGIDCEMRFDERIYGASTSTLLDLISSVGDEYSSLMLVGHNPTFENMTSLLTGETKRTPTATLAVIEFEVNSWAAVSPRAGRLKSFIRPKEEKAREKS